MSLRYEAKVVIHTGQNPDNILLNIRDDFAFETLDSEEAEDPVPRKDLDGCRSHVSGCLRSNEGQP